MSKPDELLISAERRLEKAEQELREGLNDFLTKDGGRVKVAHAHTIGCLETVLAVITETKNRILQQIALQQVIPNAEPDTKSVKV